MKPCLHGQNSNHIFKTQAKKVQANARQIRSCESNSGNESSKSHTHLSDDWDRWEKDEKETDHHDGSSHCEALVELKNNSENHPRHDSWSHKMKCIMSNPFTTIILIKIPSPNGFSCQANEWSSLFQGYPNCWGIVVALHAAFVDASEEEEIIVHSQCEKEATGWIHHRPLQPTCSCDSSRNNIFFRGNPTIPNYQVKLLLDLGSLD